MSLLGQLALACFAVAFCILVWAASQNPPPPGH